MRRAAVCSFIPPHILRSISERGDSGARRDAAMALDVAARLRGERGTQAVLASLPSETRRTMFDARNTLDLPGKRVRRENDPRTRDRAVDELFDRIGTTLTFLRHVYDRLSIDGAGLSIEATVHYGVRDSNAMWNGRQLVYGDGDGRYFRRFTSAVDVAAHELAHGITQYTAGLDYHGQAGALNEHFSDVFAVLAKQHTLKQTASRADWLIGAGLFTKRVQGDAVRSMKRPGTAYDDPVLGKDPQPSHMQGYVKTRLDGGGVHINSGIPNRVFYEIATLLGGKAWEVPGRIWYRTLTQKLRPRSTFQSCADATYAAAAELYGRASIPQQAVLAAWKTVGIDVSEGTRLQIKVAETFDLPAGGAELPETLPLLRT
jgi:Zn-dependent metalloprotease